MPLKSIMGLSFYYSILVPPLSPLPGRIISRNYKFLLFNRLKNKLTYFSNHQKLPKFFYWLRSLLLLLRFLVLLLQLRLILTSSIGLVDLVSLEL